MPLGFCNWLASMQSLCFVGTQELRPVRQLLANVKSLSLFVHPCIYSVGRDLASLEEPETVW